MLMFENPEDAKLYIARFLSALKLAKLQICLSPPVKLMRLAKLLSSASPPQSICYNFSNISSDGCHP